jgi:hypothetical protein
MKEKEKSYESVNEKLKELVITKINAELPSNLRMSMGSEGVLTKEDMIKHVRAGDKQGKQIVDMHVNFIKALVSGELIEEINSV